jgi:hypothetical protein
MGNLSIPTSASAGSCSTLATSALEVDIGGQAVGTHGLLVQQHGQRSGRCVRGI